VFSFLELTTTCTWSGYRDKPEIFTLRQESRPTGWPCLKIDLFLVFMKGSETAALFLIELVISFIAKPAWILAIYLIRAGILELHHCLAVDIPPAEGRNWGEESDVYLRFHFSNSHESLWAGCTKAPAVSIQAYTSISYRQSHHTACSLLHSLYLARRLIS